MAELGSGRPTPLGASVNEQGVNFALFSAHAEAVELCLFDDKGRETARHMLPSHSGDVFYGLLRGARSGQRYGFRVHGAWQPSAGDRFNPHKLLIDPYTRALDGQLEWNDALYAYQRGHVDVDLSFDKRDSARYMPKCVVTAPQSRRQAPARPSIEDSERIIYEAHTKGLTKHLSGIEKHRRGSYAALGSRPLMRHMRDLGVTTLELLPIHGFVDDEFLVKGGLVNYWGYQSLTFMAPDARYAATDDPAKELLDAIKTIHRNGFEVFLDVVYNHTCEGNELGPNLCYRGIDNRSYYRLADDRRYYLNDSGTGNTFATEHPRVLQLVMDSLRFWYSEMCVDGFRFDLATILGREIHGFDRGAGFFDALHQDPTLAEATLIAEPWDIGPGGYQLGEYPAVWSEWNDRFRDTARRFWVKNEPELPALADCLLGSGSVFDKRGRAPRASVNFITAHDGFTLADLVSHDVRHNEANGEGNRDGHAHEHSWNHGVEGETQDADIRAARALTRRNLMTTLMVSQGTPMMLAGDEFGRSQSGNNNAYCQDNELTWLQWPGKRQRSDDSEQAQFYRFVQRLLGLRRTLSPLRQSRWLHGRRTSRRYSLPETTWLRADGKPMQGPDWNGPDAKAVGLQLLGDTDENSTDERPAAVLILINNQTRDWSLALSAPDVAKADWITVLDTAEADGAPAANGQSAAENATLTAKSNSVLIARCYT
jgi:glycogen operon protein